MKKYVAIIVGIIILAIILENVYGTKEVVGEETIPYFINENYFLDRYKPVLCLHEPPTNAGYTFEELQQITKKSVDDWVYKLIDNSGNEVGWYIDIITIPAGTADFTGELDHCNINVIFTNNTPIDLITGSYVKGGTWHYERVIHWSDIKVYTWDYFPIESKMDNKTGKMVPQWQAKVAPKEVLVQVLEHELGHAFGLRHWELNGKSVPEEYYIKEHANKSIMYYATSPFYDEDKTIKEIDIFAIIYKYGTDGWGGWTHYNYDVYKYIK